MDALSAHFSDRGRGQDRSYQTNPEKNARYDAEMLRQTVVCRVETSRDLYGLPVEDCGRRDEHGHIDQSGDGHCDDDVPALERQDLGTFLSGPPHDPALRQRGM